ncbi:MAG: Fic family protein, partial [Deltaproteobacteria bacterium]|nr:Fic family protein [Deltaproteobacteria bacterium]
SAYYQILEQTQKSDLDITLWLEWFVTILIKTLADRLQDIDNVIDKSQFWLRIDQTKLNAQQVKVLNRLLDGDFSQGISSSQYQKVAKVSRATATRHLALLVELGCLEKTASGGRSTRYCATTL